MVSAVSLRSVTFNVCVIGVVRAEPRLRVRGEVSSFSCRVWRRVTFVARRTKGERERKRRQHPSLCTSRESDGVFYWYLCLSCTWTNFWHQPSCESPIDLISHTKFGGPYPAWQTQFSPGSPRLSFLGDSACLNTGKKKKKVFFLLVLIQAVGEQSSCCPTLFPQMPWRFECVVCVCVCVQSQHCSLNIGASLIFPLCSLVGTYNNKSGEKCRAAEVIIIFLFSAHSLVVVVDVVGFQSRSLSCPAEQEKEETEPTEKKEKEKCFCFYQKKVLVSRSLENQPFFLFRSFSPCKKIIHEKERETTATKNWNWISNLGRWQLLGS